MIFVDTSAILAVANPLDHNHATAARVWQRLVAEKEGLISTNYVLVETVALLQARQGLDAVRAFHSAVAPLLQITWIDQTIHDAALQALAVANRRDLSLVDCTSIIVARQYNLHDCFAFDRHFAEQGFHCLAW
jgi:uncharacterized protein